MAGFHEGRTNFLPTYKYIPGDEVTKWYDQRPDKKKRCPAWCDRVLWRRKHSNHHEEVTLLQYRRVEGLYISDHKPVNALFEVKVKEIDIQGKHRMLERVVGEAEKVTKRNHSEVTVEGCFNVGNAFREGKPAKGKEGGGRMERSKSSVFGRRRSGVRKSGSQREGTHQGNRDEDMVILINTGETNAKYTFVGLPAWAEVGEGDVEGVVGKGERKKIFVTTKQGYEAEVNGRYMDVVMVEVEGGMNKCFGAINWKLRWEGKEKGGLEGKKAAANQRKMAKMLGMR